MRFIFILLLFLFNVVYGEELIPVVLDASGYVIKDGHVLDGDTKCYYSPCHNKYCVKHEWIIIMGYKDHKYRVYSNIINLRNDFKISLSDSSSLLIVKTKTGNNIIGYVKDPKDAKPIIFEEKC